MLRSAQKILPLLPIVCMLGACSNEKYAYVGDAPRGESMEITNRTEQVIRTGDQLYIYVYSQNLASVRPFNQETNMSIGGDYSDSKRTTTPGYTVGQTGAIHFPVVGRIEAAGKTLSQLEREIEGLLVVGRLVKDPTVTISLMNFRVTVIGEVATPQMLTTDGTRMTIFEAIARCGDVTMDGIRSSVTVIRPTGEDYIVDTVDLTSRSILQSDYYYLQTGDVVYVEPTKRKKRVAYRNEDWPKYLSTGVSALRIAYSLYYRYVRVCELERQRNQQR